MQNYCNKNESVHQEPLKLEMYSSSFFFCFFLFLSFYHTKGNSNCGQEGQFAGPILFPSTTDATYAISIEINELKTEQSWMF